MGHPQNSCPVAKKIPQRKKKTTKKPKRWKFPKKFPTEEENDEEMDRPTNEEAQNTQENIEKGRINYEVLGTPAHTLRQDMIPVEIEIRDSKCHHVSKSLDSDKENERMNEGTQLELVMTTPS